MRQLLLVPLLLTLPTVATADPFRPEIVFSFTITSVTTECRRNCDPPAPLTASPWFTVGQTFGGEAQYTGLGDRLFQFIDFPAPDAFPVGVFAPTDFAMDETQSVVLNIGTQWDDNQFSITPQRAGGLDPFLARVHRYQPDGVYVRDVIRASMVQTPVSVPEPATAVLLAIGAALVCRRRTARAGRRA